MAATLAPGWFYRAEFAQDPSVEAVRRTEAGERP